MKRNRLRSIEVGIFTVVSLVFLNSVYHLFTDGRFLTNQAPRPLAASSDMRGAASRGPKPASVTEEASAITKQSHDMIPYEIQCLVDGERLETAAAKVRVTGPFCGASNRGLASDRPEALIEKGVTPYQLKIQNDTNSYAATVLSDQQSGTFSTDFIPLEMGPNKVSMAFFYKKKKPHVIELSVTRK